MMANAQELYLPQGPVRRLASPDGSRILYGVPYEKSTSGGPQLWIEDTRTHRQTKLFDIGGTLSAGWSINGSAFYVNDHWASDRERAYIYDAATLKRLSIGDRILAEDPRSRRFAGGHNYFEVERWNGAQDVSAKFFGHTDEPPVTCFVFDYRISLTGVVKKLSQQVAPITAKLCEG